MVGAADASGLDVIKAPRGEPSFARPMEVVADASSWAVPRVQREKLTTAYLMVGAADATT